MTIWNRDTEIEDAEPPGPQVRVTGGTQQ